MKDTLMILGANTLQIPLIERANQLGYNTLLFLQIRKNQDIKYLNIQNIMIFEMK